MGKVRILQLIKSLGRGGAEMLLPQTLKIHDQNEFQFYYVYFLPWKDQMVGAIESSGGRVTCFSASNNIEILQQAKNLASYCRENKIDIIHSHLPWSGFLARMVHKKSGIPVIYTEHNIQERYHFVTKKINKWSFNSQTMALGVSEDVTKSIIENISPNIPVRTVVNGVNTELFQRSLEKGNKIRKNYGIPKEALVIGNIAVFRAQKGINVWLKAFKGILIKRPGVYGLLVGAGPMEEEIKSSIKKMGLTEKIILPGLQVDTISFFSAMDIFMMSSNFEGLPIALLEAMSMGCAVASTKAGGVVEAVREDEDGFLCEVGDFHCLAEKTLVLLEDNELRKKMQNAARCRVENDFSLNRMVDELEEIYNDLLTK